MENKLIYVWISREKATSFYGIELALYKAGYEMRVFNKGNELQNDALDDCCAFIIEFDTLLEYKEKMLQLIKKRYKAPLIAYFQQYDPRKIESSIKAGFNDFLINDYSVELVQRKIVSILDNSSQIITGRTVNYQNLKIDEIGNAYCNEEFMDLSRRESAALLLLILADGNRVSKNMFQERLWPGEVVEKSIRDTILRLRKKLKEFHARCEIVSLNSWGYMLEMRKD